MSFKKTSLQTSLRGRRNRRARNKKTILQIILKLLFFVVIFGTISVIIGGFVLYKKIIEPLPSVTKLKEFSIPQTSSIYDREGNLLYSVFKEKRTYVDLKNINKNMINAIIAGEDKRFWTNPGFDLIGLIRASINGIRTGHISATSTISQQLVKNTFLNNERSYKRKIKEIYLSYKMTQRFSKETIIELYLNKISFGNNSYGVEQASETYLGKKANELNYLDASILASMPKGPTLFSPYRFKNKKGILVGYPRLMGYLYVYKKGLVEGIKNKAKRDILIEKNRINLFPNIDNSKYKTEIYKFKKVINSLKVRRLYKKGNKIVVCGMNRNNFKNNSKNIPNIGPDGCIEMKYENLLNLLNNIRIKVGNNYVEYQTGRKDFILQRMLEDGYLSKKGEDEFLNYKNAIKNGILFNFKKNKTKIKYPHFVFYVKEYLEEKYGKTAMEEGGFKIYTTLVPEIQEKAQQIVEKQVEVNMKRFNANNAATVVIDNKKGEIIAMVGGKDYYDKTIDGENNIITSKLQPGSTFKPFVYALSMFVNAIGPKTPVFDVQTTFPGGYIPNNFDGEFIGKMSVEKALNHSRNVPAIKMFFLAGGEKKIIDFMRKLGVESYYDFKKYYRNKYKKEYIYGSPMALGTGEMTPLELATAYSTIASMGNKKELTPILKIIDKNGNDLRIREKEQTKVEEAISPKIAYLITSILTNTEARPKIWNLFLTIPGRKLAAKTGTSTKQFEVEGEKKIFPQNLWTIGYTPQYTTVAWAGNTNGKELNYSGNGLEGAGPIMRDIMTEIHKEEKVEDWKKPDGITEVTISSNSGKLPIKTTPEDAKVKGLFINEPVEYEENYSIKKVDLLCNGKVTKETPIDAIKVYKGVKYHSLRPYSEEWETPVNKLSTFKDIKYNNQICERGEKDSKMQIGVIFSNNGLLVSGANYVELAYKSKNPITKLEILLNGKKISNYTLPGKLEGLYKGSFNIPFGIKGRQILTVKVIDNWYYSKSISKNVVLGGRDTEPPKIILVNPVKGIINLKKDTNFNLRVNFLDISPIRVVNIYLNGKKLYSPLKSNKIIVPINSKLLEKGKYNLKIEATDINFNTSTKNIIVDVFK